MINDVRQGAAKYKAWLVREFQRNGMSTYPILQTLYNGDVVARPDLELQNSDQNTALIYSGNFC